jgi:hypothetical protein
MRVTLTPHWRVFDRPTILDVSRIPAPGALAAIRIGYLRDQSRCSGGERHEYILVVEIENVGSVTLTDFRLDILFPKVFMDIESYGFEVQKLETSTHKLIRRTAAHFPEFSTGFYPGDKIVDKLIKYSISFQRWYQPEFTQSLVEVTLVANGMARQQAQNKMKELSNF